jgi:hypothetical protein
LHHLFRKIGELAMRLYRLTDTKTNTVDIDLDNVVAVQRYEHTDGRYYQKVIFKIGEPIYINEADRKRLLDVLKDSFGIPEKENTDIPQKREAIYPKPIGDNSKSPKESLLESEFYKKLNKLLFEYLTRLNLAYQLPLRRHKFCVLRSWTNFYEDMRKEFTHKIALHGDEFDKWVELIELVLVKHQGDWVEIDVTDIGY